MKASVIISAFNSAEFIAETIQSILDQDYDDYEIIVVDDGSTDETKSVVLRFSDQAVPVKYIYQENSGGPSRPRNVGIRESKGEYLFIFDSDDIMLPGKIYAQVAALDEHPDAVAAFTQFQSTDEDGTIIREQFLRDYYTLWNLLPDGIDTDVGMISSDGMFKGLIKSNFVGTSSVAMRASTVKGYYEFDESMTNADDRLMWVTLAQRHPWVFLGTPYHQYRERKSSITRNALDRRAASLVYGLEQMRELCRNKDDIRLVNTQISDVYWSLAYNQRKRGDFAKAIQSSLQSLRHHLSWAQIRLLLSIVWYGSRSLFLGKHETQEAK